MPWYAVSTIMHVRLLGRSQDRFRIWENVILIEAKDQQSAAREGERLGSEDARTSSDGLTWEGARAEWVFDGVRKVVKVA